MNRLSIIILTALSFLLISGGAALRIDHGKNVEEMRVALQEKTIDAQLKQKKREIEFFFKTMYQSARTISLLPSVRGIQGGNIKSSDEDIVESGRFTEEGYLSVQQLYNNLASNFNISEIYCILDGFNPKAGETPFFMYDSLIMGKAEDSREGDDEHGDDFPEEEEEEEYDYYIRQLAQFKNIYPKFVFRNLDDIPATFSPAMRTCDNTQYTSTSKYEAKEAYGVLYSVPFYDLGDSMKGIISVIFRTNVFEAALVGVPFIPVTEGDKAEARRLNFQLPEEASGFALYDDKYGLNIFDRRNGELAKILENGRYENLLTVDLDVTGDNKWKLAYHISNKEYAAALAGLSHSFWLKLAILTVGVLAGMAITVLSSYRKKQYMGKIEEFAGLIQDIAEGEGDLTKRVDAAAIAKELRPLAHWFNVFVENIRGIISEITGSADALAESSIHLSEISEVISSGAGNLSFNAESVENSSKEINDNLSAVAHEMDEASSVLMSMAACSEEMSATISETVVNADSARNITEDAVRKTNEATARVKKLGEKAQEIDKITQMITEISEQTKLLALNATIEAARAGSAGKGFAVVAGEIKDLARQTFSATDEIKKRISDMRASTEETTEGINSVTSIISKTNELMVQLAAAIEEESTTMNEIAKGVSKSSNVVTDTCEAISRTCQASMATSTDISKVNEASHEMSESGAALDVKAKNLSTLAETLRQMVGQFKI